MSLTGDAGAAATCNRCKPPTAPRRTTARLIKACRCSGSLSLPVRTPVVLSVCCARFSPTHCCPLLPHLCSPRVELRRRSISLDTRLGGGHVSTPARCVSLQLRGWWCRYRPCWHCGLSRVSRLFLSLPSLCLTAPSCLLRCTVTCTRMPFARISAPRPHTRAAPAQHGRRWLLCRALPRAVGRWLPVPRGRAAPRRLCAGGKRWRFARGGRAVRRTARRCAAGCSGIPAHFSLPPRVGRPCGGVALPV